MAEPIQALWLAGVADIVRTRGLQAAVATTGINPASLARMLIDAGAIGIVPPTSGGPLSLPTLARMRWLERASIKLKQYPGVFAVFLLQSKCGLRTSECVAADWADYKPGRGSHRQPTLTINMGGRARSVPIAPRVVSELAKLNGGTRAGPLVPGRTPAERKLAVKKLGRWVTHQLGAHVKTDVLRYAYVRQLVKVGGFAAAYLYSGLSAAVVRKHFFGRISP